MIFLKRTNREFPGEMVQWCQAPLKYCGVNILGKCFSVHCSPMGRAHRTDVGGYFYHALNRANGRATIFQSDADYLFFETLLFETLQDTGVLCVAYAIMPNHWHLLRKTFQDGDLSYFMQNLTLAHARHLHIKNDTIGNGHVYQGRYKSHLVETDNYFLGALKYIERNPVRARMCRRAEDWRWSSAYHRVYGTNLKNLLDLELPLPLTPDYKDWINRTKNLTELDCALLPH